MKILQWAKRVVTGGIATGSTLLIACAYGPIDESYTVRGTVKKEGDPVPGLKVCTVHGEDAICTTTDSNGFFVMDTKNLSYMHDGFTVCVEDIDGDDNGSIQAECMSVEPNVKSPVNINMNVSEQ